MLYKSNLKIQEGKAQALSYIKKKFSDNPFIDDKMIKHLINQMEDVDPTKPKNKYVETYVRLFYDYYTSQYLVALARGDVDGEKPEDDKDRIFQEGFFFYNSITDFKRELNKTVVPNIKNIELRNMSIDLTKIKTFKDFNKTVDELASTLTNSSKKKGISGLKLGKDYLQIPTPNKLDTQTMILIPLSYKASKIIASEYIGHCEGKWCTAYQKTDEYWVNYIEEEEGTLVYIVRGASPTIPPNESKMAIYFHGTFQSEGFDANDNDVNPKSIIYFNEIEKYVKANDKKIHDLIEQEMNNKSPEEKMIKEFNQYQPDMHTINEALKTGISPNNALIEFAKSLKKHEFINNHRILEILVKHGGKELDLSKVNNAEFLIDFLEGSRHGISYMSRLSNLRLFIQLLDESGLKLKINISSDSDAIIEAFIGNDEEVYMDKTEEYLKLLNGLGIDTTTYTKRLLPVILHKLLYNLIDYEYDCFDVIIKYMKMATLTQLGDVRELALLSEVSALKFKKSYFNFTKWKKIFFFFLKKGFDINLSLREHGSPLTQSMIMGFDRHFSLDKLKYLIANGADPNKKDPYQNGKSPLEYFYYIMSVSGEQNVDKKGIEEVLLGKKIKEALYKSKFKGKL